MKNLSKKILLIAGVLMGVVCIKALAQTQERNVTVHIIQEDGDGETKRIKKTFTSEEEMKKDPDMVEYLSDENGKQYTFKFRTDSTTDERVVKLRRWSEEHRSETLDSIMKRAEKQIAIIRERRLDLDSLWEERDNVVKELQLRWNSDTTAAEASRFFDNDFFKMEWFDKEDVMARLNRDWKDFDVYVEEYSRGKDGRSGRNNSRFEERARASIMDLDPVADAAYIKKEKYDHAKAPLISGLKLVQDYRPSRYILSFYFPNEEPLTLRLTTLSGDVVYVEGLALFKGRYERSINMESVTEMEFYLEISEGKKKVIKKVRL